MRPAAALLALHLSTLPAAAAATPAADAAVLRAAARGDVTALREALAAGGSVDAADLATGSALYLAVSRGQAGTAEALLDAGAQGLKSLHGLVPARLLVLAAWSGDAPMVRLLLARGAGPSALDPDGGDALGGAVVAGSADVLRLLLDAGADPERRTGTGLPAAARAALHGKADLLRLLLERGADPERRDREGNTPLHLAAATGQEGTLAVLLERKVRLHPVNGRQRTALDEAKAIKDPALRERVVAALLAAGAREGQGVRPVDAGLLAAADRGQLAAVKAALRDGADVAARGTLTKGTWHRDALTAAVAHPAVFRHLLEAGADPLATDGAGFTVLHAAADRGAPEVVDLLLARGADPDAHTENGFTPLFQAVNGRARPAVVARLLAGGADPGGRTISGEPLLDYARQHGQGAVVKLLEEALRARGAARVSAAPGLAGCWRYQVQSQRWADGRNQPSNSRCVLEIGPGELRSHCPGQDRPAIHSWSPVDGGHIALRRDRTGAPRPPAAPLHAAWRVEGRWLRWATEQPRAKAGEAPKPFAMESVLIRTAPAADGACRPGSPSPLRTAKGAPSSVTFTPPEGWAPLLKDGADVPAAARLLGGGLLVAMLVPAAEVEAAAESAARASAFVVVVDDTGGPAPVLPEGFPAVKAALRKELGGLAEACDGPRTLCLDRPAAGGAAPASFGFVQAEGRLLVVHATAPAAEAARRARDAVVDRLLALEP